MLTGEMVNRGIEFCPEKMESYHPYWTVKPKKAEELHMTKSQKTSALNSLSNAVRALAMVPKAGLEPARYRYQRILSPSRLPFHHFGMNKKYYSIFFQKCKL